ncbi:zinc finger protein 271-like [Cydia splendana]|uniref:zinc finger protein 271-like n=1 Tax=Cydia splendana TaxID=1100963 RepID=UPI00300CDE65
MHKFYKWCSVPLCKNSTKTTPSKLFVYVPLNKKIREKWLTLAKRDTACIPTSCMWFCEDHFDIPNDMENYMQYHVMGSVSRVHMKTGCIPTKFACQPDREQYITGHRDLYESPVHIKEQTEDMQHSDCQMETQCVDQIKEESSCSHEECSMSKAVMLASLYTNHKPLCLDSTGYGVSEAEKLADELKEEALSDGMECGMTGMSESTMLAGADTDHDVKDGLVLGSERVKEEPSLSESVEYGMSEAAMLADLYADHVVKDELVLGPEHPHRPDVSLVVLDWALADEDGCLQESQEHTSQPALKDCCVRLERLHHEAPAEHIIQDTTHTDSKPYTEDKIYTKIDLFEEKPLQERVLSRDSPLALRDCCVRLEHLQHHEALAGNDTTHTDTESDTENIYARDCIINNRTTTSDTDNDNENIYARDCKRMFICDLCGKKFALKAGLMKHVVIHIHVPANAGSVEPNNSNYKVSTNVSKDNSDIDEYVCDTCRKTFRRKYDLIRHIQNTHTQTSSKIIKTTPTVYECNKVDKITYPCDTCGIHFTQKVYLITHKRIHTDKRPYSCNICEKRFKTSGCLKIHERVHTGLKPYSGEPCNKQFQDVRLLNKHKKVHTGEKPYMCEICKKQFSNILSLNIHKVTHTGITCEICKEHFRQWEQFRIHTRTHTGGTIYTCALCNMKFASVWKFNAHKRTHTNERPYACGICEKRYTRASHLTRHNRYHTSEKPFSCKMCDKKYSERDSLCKHILSHTGVKPYSCEICKKRFSQKSSLNRHILSHTGAKPYSCEICKTRFAQKSSLNRHILSHTGTKSYSCEICKKRFAHKCNLNTHIRSHTGAKPYSCEICKRRFAHKCNLNTHIRSHTGAKPYSCEICKKRFAHKGSLNTHIRSHTGAKPYSCLRSDIL